MKAFWRITITFLFLIISAFFHVVFAQQTLQGVGFSGQFFVSYEYDMFEDGQTNEFTIKRGYITFRDDINDRFGIRFTQDITIDQQGDGAGDIELRLKYALLKYSMDDIGIFSSPNIEAGVVHRPWIDFEQSVNDYRAQKPMLLDQNDILSSADFGMLFEAGIGKELPSEKQNGLKSNTAKYGSLGIGLYNGGGYSKIETNNNKLIEARLSLRPFPNKLPGLQSSLLGAYGQGNIPEGPKFNLMGSAITYESNRLNVVMQAFRSIGDSAGLFTDTVSGTPYRLEGWSVFTEIQPFNTPIYITTRYDELFNRDFNHLIVQQWVAGLAYVYKNRSKIILDVSREDLHPTLHASDFTRFEVVIEVIF